MADQLSALSCSEFAERLASAEPVPGGGGAAALTASLAASLGAMAANLSLGKKKLLSFEADHRRIIDDCNRLRLRFLALIEEDAAAFEPLSRIYAADKNSPGYEAQLRAALLSAAAAPFAMMRCCAELTALLEELREKCSALLLSDVGCAALAARSALECASLNVFVNTRLLPGDEEAGALSEAAAALLECCVPRAQAVADAVMRTLKTPKN